MHMLSGHCISALLAKGTTSISEAGMTPSLVAFVLDALRPFSNCRIRERGYGCVEICDGILLGGAHVDATLVISSEAFEVAAHLPDKLHCVQNIGFC